MTQTHIEYNSFKNWVRFWCWIHHFWLWVRLGKMFFTKFWLPRDIAIHCIKASWPARTCSMTLKWPFYSIFFHSIWNWASVFCIIFHFSLGTSIFPSKITWFHVSLSKMKPLGSKPQKIYSQCRALCRGLPS